MSGTETSKQRTEANRKNAQKSTGPRTDEGKARSRFNAVKHGMRASTPILPGEDPIALKARLDSWTESLKPADDVEQFLVGRAVQLSWQLERSDRALASHRSERADGTTRQAEEVADLGRRLFRDPRSPIGLYPIPATEFGHRVSLAEKTYSLDHPATLMIQLEATALGCAWLLDRWTDLRDLLDSGQVWLPPDRFRAVRLLGHQPMDLIDDRRLMTIYVATEAMLPDGDDPLDDLQSELDPIEWKRFSERIHARKSLAGDLSGPDAGRSALMAIVSEEERRLEELLTMHLERGAVPGSGTISRDEAPELDQLRRYQAACDRALLRILETLRKRHRDAIAPNEPNEPPSPNEANEPPAVAVEEIATNEANRPASPGAIPDPTSRGDARRTTERPATDRVSPILSGRTCAGVEGIPGRSSVAPPVATVGNDLPPMAGTLGRGMECCLSCSPDVPS